MPNKQNMPNEYHPELLSLHGINFAVGNNSSSRSVMMSSHFSQRLVIAGADEKYIETGVGYELGKSTFATRMPVDGRVVRVIQRYPASVGIDSIPSNPETLVIYEDEKTKELGCFSINYYTSYHQYFGYKNQFNKSNMSKLVQGAFIPADTIFADTPAKGENGSFKFGVNLNVAFGSLPGVSEDGIVISKDVLPKLRFKIYERRVIDCGTSRYLLNLYGNKDVYKPIPEIGEYIKESGLVAMTRDYDHTLGPVEMSRLDTMEPDYMFDKAIYARPGVGKVVDIKIYHDDESVLSPTGTMDIPNKYSRALKRYYRNIIDTFNQIKAERKKKYDSTNVPLKPELHRLIVEGMAVLGEPAGKHTQKLGLLYRKTPLDDYRIEMTIEYELTPTTGFKLTDLDGG